MLRQLAVTAAFCCPRHRGPHRVAKARRRAPSASKLETLAEKMSHVVAADLFGGFTALKAKSDYRAMAQAVYSGKYKDVTEHVPWAAVKGLMAEGLSGLRDSMADASEIAADGVITAAQGDVPKDTDLSLGTDNKAVKAYIATRTGELVQNVNEDTRQFISGVIDRAKTSRDPPSVLAREIAGNLRDGIGLNDRQATALANYRASLTADGTSPGQVDRLAGAYGERLLKQRSMMIARTEVAYANNQSQLLVWNDAQEQGLISETATKVWVVDGDPCDICEALDGTEVPIGEQFETIDGDEVSGPPIHPHCLCSLSLG